ncbi:MAG: hypothetical protein OHK0039_43510 [Bacteroidia bacterium]
MLFFILLSFTFSLMLEAQHSKKDDIVVISTDYGDMYIVLYHDTPKHRENFLKLAAEGYYDGTGFHRIIKDFMIQGGDPNSKAGGNDSQTGMGGPGYTLPAEILPRYGHVKGALAAARQGDQVNPKRESSGSQFYIVHDPKNCRHLDGSYTIFGQVIKGLDVVDKIAVLPVSSATNKPNAPVRITVTVQSMKKKEIAAMYGEELLYGGSED